jgi:hypothetical protein
MAGALERSPAALRPPFGAAVDLDLDFSTADRPALVTALLARGRADGAGDWWQRSVGERIAALVDLLVLSDGRRCLDLHATCASPRCGETFGFELPLDALPKPMPGTVRIVLDGGRGVELRRPCGDDLRRWRSARPATRRDAVRTMLESLCIAGTVEDADAQAVAAALAEADPLVDFEVQGRCPACDAATTISVDLESLVLARLAERQKAIESELHRLALHYGWTEAQSLAIPPARRRRYLDRIDAEAGR